MYLNIHLEDREGVGLYDPRLEEIPSFDEQMDDLEEVQSESTTMEEDD